MNQYLKRAGAVLLALALTTLAACASAPPRVTPTQMAAVKAGEQSVIVFVGGGGVAFTFTNVDTGQTYEVQTDNVWKVLPGVTAVPPGRYRLTDAGAAFTPLLDVWFADVEIGPGEVVYLGSFESRGVTVYRATSDGEKILSLLRLDLEPPGGHVYYSYGVGDYWSENTRKYMQDEYPGLAAVMVDRPLQPLIETEAFEAAVTEAYGPRDGVMPTPAQAEARARIAIATLVARSRAAADQ